MIVNIINCVKEEPLVKKEESKKINFDLYDEEKIIKNRIMKLLNISKTNILKKFQRGEIRQKLFIAFPHHKYLVTKIIRNLY